MAAGAAGSTPVFRLRKARFVHLGYRGKIGWGGRIRTFTIHINSVVSYRLDHAPAALAADLQPTDEVGSAAFGRDGGFF
jgi:hypothetical protein